MKYLISVEEKLKANEKVDCDEGRQIVVGVHNVYTMLDEASQAKIREMTKDCLLYTSDAADE